MMFKKIGKLSGLLLVLCLLPWARGASAQTINPSDFTSITGPYVKALIETAAVTSLHRPLSSASPLGMAAGLEIGVDLSYVFFPTAFKDALVAIGAGNISGIPVPKVNFRKGLPAHLDFGLSAITYAGMTMAGGDVQWALLSGMGPLPAVAARVGYNYSSLFFLKTHTFNIDAVVSKNLFIFDPYLGLGTQIVSGGIDVPLSLAGTFPVNLSSSYTGVLAHFFGGLSVKLLILKIVGEVDYNFNGTTTYGARAVLSF